MFLRKDFKPKGRILPVPQKCHGCYVTMHDGHVGTFCRLPRFIRIHQFLEVGQFTQTLHRGHEASSKVVSHFGNHRSGFHYPVPKVNIRELQGHERRRSWRTVDAMRWRRTAVTAPTNGHYCCASTSWSRDYCTGHAAPVMKWRIGKTPGGPQLGFIWSTCVSVPSFPDVILIIPQTTVEFAHHAIEIVYTTNQHGISYCIGNCLHA